MSASLLFALVLSAPATDLTFVRHGETLANATGKYNARTIDTFSPKGENQVKALTDKLLREKPYDLILVSPSPRALKTIAPYLQASHRQAYIWPLLYECCTQKRPTNAHATKFEYRGQIQVPTPIAPLFRMMAKETRYPVSSDYNAGLAQVAESVRVFRKLYSGKRVLLVGHSGHGGQFLRALTGRSYHVENAAPIHLKL